MEGGIMGGSILKVKERKWRYLQRVLRVVLLEMIMLVVIVIVIIIMRMEIIVIVM